MEPDQSGRVLSPEEQQARLDNHYGYCTLPPDHDGPCGTGRVSSFTRDVRDGLRDFWHWMREVVLW